MDRYFFRREDNGELVDVSFEDMMRMDSAGYLILPDGVAARRCRSAERPDEEVPKNGSPAAVSLIRPLVSDALGFLAHQLPDFEADRQRHGFSGVEFHPDPQVPEFIQVHVSRSEWERYVRHRGMVDRNSLNGSGACPSAEEFEQLRLRMVERYGEVPARAA